MGAIAAVFQKTSRMCASAQIYLCRVMSESIHLIDGGPLHQSEKKSSRAQSSAAYNSFLEPV